MLRHFPSSVAPNTFKWDFSGLALPATLLPMFLNQDGSTPIPWAPSLTSVWALFAVPSSICDLFTWSMPYPSPCLCKQTCLMKVSWPASTWGFLSCSSCYCSLSIYIHIYELLFLSPLSIYTYTHIYEGRRPVPCPSFHWAVGSDLLLLRVKSWASLSSNSWDFPDSSSQLTGQILDSPVSAWQAQKACLLCSPGPSGIQNVLLVTCKNQEAYGTHPHSLLALWHLSLGRHFCSPPQF